MVPNEAVEDARRHRDAGQVGLGRARLLHAAETGDIQAMVELAKWCGDEGDESQSQSWIARAEALISDDDLDGHIVLSGAYSLGFGSGSVDEQNSRALSHLVKVADAGNARVQEEVALHYLHGLNGCPVDLEKYWYWTRRATQASDDNLIKFVSYSLSQKLQVPTDLIERLSELKEKREEAARLLKRAKRRK